MNKQKKYPPDIRLKLTVTVQDIGEPYRSTTGQIDWPLSTKMITEEIMNGNLRQLLDQAIAAFNAQVNATKLVPSGKLGKQSRIKRKGRK